MRTAVLLADGFETIEALATVDVLRRGGKQVSTVTINPKPRVTTAQGVTLECDDTLDTYDFDDCGLIVLPGGLPGTTNLRANERVCELVRLFMAERNVGAICAAPSILAALGLLEGRTATCYPGFEKDFPAGVRPAGNGVYRDGNLVTASGPAFAWRFGLENLRTVAGDDAVATFAAGMLQEA